jgi:hypothetical protein
MFNMMNARSASCQGAEVPGSERALIVSAMTLQALMR